MSPVFRPATKADMAEFYDEAPTGSVRAWVADLDGKVIGIAGCVYVGDKVVAFSAMKEEMRAFPVTIMRAARFIAKKLPPGAVAKAYDQEKHSAKLLERLGFEPLDANAGTYRWRGHG